VKFRRLQRWGQFAAQLDYLMLRQTRIEVWTLTWSDSTPDIGVKIWGWGWMIQQIWIKG